MDVSALDSARRRPTMLSRVADALYWMARYVERAEHAARVLEVTRRVLIDLEESDPQRAKHQRARALQTLGISTDVSLEAAVLEDQLPGSVAFTLSRARENARQVREVVSSEMWDYLNQAYWVLEDAASSKRKREVLSQTIGSIMQASFLWAGVTDATMDRGPGWLMIRLGQFVERVDRTSHIFSSHWMAADAPADNLNWITLLRSCGCLEEYRKRHPTRIGPRDVVEFVLLHPTYPRSVHYSAVVAREFVKRLSSFAPTRRRGPERAFGRLAARVEFADVDEVLEQGVEGFLREVSEDLSRATLELQRAYFLH